MMRLQKQIGKFSSRIIGGTKVWPVVFQLNEHAETPPSFTVPFVHFKQVVVNEADLNEKSLKEPALCLRVIEEKLEISMKEHDLTMTGEHRLIHLMKTMPSSKNSRAAFTLSELCVVITCVAVLAMLVLPALAASKTQSASAGCLYNLRHLMIGWEMYRTENNDYLMPNAPLGYVAGWVSPQGAENWANAPANTNPVYYTSGLLWPYLGNNLSVYRCPGDVVPSANGTRIRSYSMNGQMGSVYFTSAIFNYNPGWLFYAKGSDIVRPTPANAFVFADESPATINDGYLQIGLNTPWFPDVPACYLEGGCGLSFADGHGEIHRWQTSVLLIPVRQGYQLSNISGVSANNADWLWFTQHASSHK